MSGITNTSKAPQLDWLFGGNPKTIEQQEAKEQEEMAKSSQLPVKMNYPKNGDTVEFYNIMGIKVIQRSKADDILLDVVLPDGWKITPTEHSMWSNLVDENGGERASIFYKAAFYDRDAFISLNTRYDFGCDYFHEEKSPTNNWDCAKIAYAKDRLTGKRLFETNKFFYEEESIAHKSVYDFLDNNFPEWKHVNAYWNDGQ